MGMYLPNAVYDSTPAPPELTNFHDMLIEGGTRSTIVPSIYAVKFAKNCWNITWSTLATLTSYTVSSLWRPPPKDGEVYENGVYLSESTREQVEKYTIPNMRAVLEEAISVG